MAHCINGEQVVKSSEAVFAPKRLGTSSNNLKVGSCKMEVTVGYSAGPFSLTSCNLPGKAGVTRWRGRTGRLCADLAGRQWPEVARHCAKYPHPSVWMIAGALCISETSIQDYLA